ncbi:MULTISPECIES: hypothetical protein [unclassified Curtobacterium]|nr:MULTISPECIES: hypothetical protein [unclassified Curtobacterium]
MRITRRSLFLSLAVAGLAWIVGVVVFGAADLASQVIAGDDG